MRKLFLALTLALAAFSAQAAENKTYVYLINNSPNTVTSVTATNDADGTSTTFDLDVPLKGGETAAVQFVSNTPGKAGCVYTVDATFNRGESLKVMDFNACRAGTLRFGSLMRLGRVARN